jgi:hypothetical protein
LQLCLKALSAWYPTESIGEVNYLWRTNPLTTISRNSLTRVRARGKLLGMDHVPLKPGPTIRVRYLPPRPLLPVSGETMFDDLPRPKQFQTTYRVETTDARSAIQRCQFDDEPIGRLRVRSKARRISDDLFEVTVTYAMTGLEYLP